MTYWPRRSRQEPEVVAMLASQAERERAVDVIKAGYAEGRLDQPEFDKRVTRAYKARTVDELGHLVADLPQGPVALSAAGGLLPEPYRPGTSPMPGSGQGSALDEPLYRLPKPKPKPPVNENAIGAAICGVLCLLTAGLMGLPAVLLAHTARAQMRRTGETGEGLVVVGLVLGWLSTAVWAAALTLLLTGALRSL